MKCGSELPALGECTVCHGKGLAAGTTPNLLNQDLNLDRRTARPPAPPSTPLGAGPAPQRTAPPVPRPAAPPIPRAAPPAVPAAPAAPMMNAPPPVRPAAPPPPRAPAPAPRAAAPAPAVSAPRVSAAAAEPGVIELHAEPASLWRRALAFTIDSALILGILGLYLAVASAIVGPRGTTHLTGLDGWMARAHSMEFVLIPGVALALILALVYSAVAGFVWNGRTLGRRLLGIQLVDRSGLAPAPARAIVRALLSAFSFAIFLGGFWLALFDRRGQTLHDKLTSTFVVRPV